eukprot:TRINITY_DN17708_c0_g1_i4.p1 TRINITY_DN17708_c0_g1~~TRINITY_DN17708_c0_g1_i4.p1  ORF type:complete len:1186 (+),score=379.01 TRINITY_DN17708_c0_g1_i4:475-3558(+)
MAAGLNADGQLGMGNRTPLSTFRPVRSLEGRWVAAVACGAHHSVVLLRDGTLLVAGRNDCGQLGLGHRQRQASFVPVASIRGVVEVCCGASYTMALLEDRSVYGAGSNDNGQLGLGHRQNQAHYVEAHGLTGRAVVAVRCGQAHTVVLTADSEVFATGLNSDGQLGLGHFDAQLSFSWAQELSGRSVTAIAAGGARTFAVTIREELLACGRNADGQLGLGGLPRAHRFRPVPLPEGAPHGVAGVICGGAHSLVVTGLADRAGGDPGEPHYITPVAGWEEVKLSERECFAARAAELEHLALTTVGLLQRYERVKRQKLNSLFNRQAACAIRIAALFPAEAAARGALAAEEQGARYGQLTEVHTAHLEAERWWRSAVEAEECARERMQADEQRAWASRYAPFHAAGDVVLAQEFGRNERIGAELLQREWIRRRSVVQEYDMYLPICHNLLDTLHNRLRPMFEHSERVRQITFTAPEPPVLLHLIRRVVDLAIACAPLDPGSALAAARKRVAVSLAELQDAAQEVSVEVEGWGGASPAHRQGEQSLKRRDQALRRCSEDVGEWQRQLHSEAVDSMLGWQEEFAWWNPCVCKLTDDRDGATPPSSPKTILAAPAAGRLPAPAAGASERAALAVLAAAEATAAAISSIELWQQEYLDAVALAEEETDAMRLRLRTVLELPASQWEQQFLNLDHLIREEERLKRIEIGLRPVPIATVQTAAPKVTAALSAVDIHARAVRMEQEVAAVLVSELEATLLAQVQMVELRKKVAKDSSRKAGLQALQTALQFGALTRAAYDAHREELYRARPQSAQERGLLQLREQVREKRVAFERQADIRRRAQVGESPDPGEQYDLALQAMQDAKRALHREQELVARRQAKLWLAAHPLLPDVEDELRRLTGSELLADLLLLPPQARALVVDRRKSEYEFERGAAGCVLDAATGGRRQCYGAGRCSAPSPACSRSTASGRCAQRPRPPRSSSRSGSRRALRLRPGACGVRSTSTTPTARAPTAAGRASSATRRAPARCTCSRCFC